MVLYSVHGICRIEDKTQRDFGGQKQEYYMLKPVSVSYTHLLIPFRKLAAKHSAVCRDFFNCSASMDGNTAFL